jgi:hypothetical protein
VVLEMPHLLEVDEMPLTFYFSIMLKGRIITIIDVVRHLQQYFDKQFAQMDHDIGHDTKTTKVLYKELIDEDYQSIEEAIDALTDGKVIVAKGTPAQGNPVQTIQRSGVSRDVFPVFELLLQLMEDSFGGRNFQGAQETGGQSGKAIAKLQAAAALIALNYMDNLRRFDMQVGKKLLKFVKKFYTHKYSLKVLGESMTAEIMNALQANGMYERSAIESGWGWITVNDPDNPKSRPISEANLNIEVNRVSVRQDEKDVEFEKLMGLKSQGYAVPVECVLDTLNLKATLKQKIIKENEKKEELQLRQLALAEKQAELDANMKVAGFTKPQVEAQMSSENGKQKREASVASGE